MHCWADLPKWQGQSTGFPVTIRDVVNTRIFSKETPARRGLVTWPLACSSEEEDIDEGQLFKTTFKHLIKLH